MIFNPFRRFIEFVTLILMFYWFYHNKFAEWFHVPNPLYLIIPGWVGGFLFYMGFPFPYFKWHLSIVLAPFKFIPFVRKVLVITDKDREVLCRKLLFKVRKDGKFVPCHTHNYIEAFPLAFFLYLQLFVWFRVLLYKLFGIKIPFAFLDPQFAPWR